MPIKLDLPIDLQVAIPVNETVPINTEIPVSLDVPISIDIAETELAELAAALQQLPAAGRMAERITGLDVQCQSPHGPPCPDAERAGQELVHDEIAGLLVNLPLF